jgi:hypothetical protein
VPPGGRGEHRGRRARTHRCRARPTPHTQRAPVLTRFDSYARTAAHAHACHEFCSPSSVTVLWASTSCSSGQGVRATAHRLRESLGATSGKKRTHPVPYTCAGAPPAFRRADAIILTQPSLRRARWRVARPRHAVPGRAKSGASMISIRHCVLAVATFFPVMALQRIPVG